MPERGAPTVLAAWTATVVRALDMHGHDGEDLAIRAGIDPAVFSDPGGRLSLAQTTALWRLAIEATQDPSFHLRVARLTRPSTFAGLSMGIVTSDTWEEALERIARYQSLVIMPSEPIELLRRGDRIVWIDRFAPTMAPCPEAVEAIMGSIVLGGRDLLGPTFGPLTVHSTRPATDDPTMLERFFRCPVILGAADYRLEFSLDEARRPLPSRSREMALVADRLARDYIAGLANSGKLRSKVRDLLTRLAPHGMPSTAEIATELAISPRTLQRRLSEEGTSLSQLTREVNTDIAAQMLVVDGLTVEAIASSLGFHDASSFRRAFRRWTGCTPSEYVARQVDEGQAIDRSAPSATDV